MKLTIVLLVASLLSCRAPTTGHALQAAACGDQDAATGGAGGESPGGAAGEASGGQGGSDVGGSPEGGAAGGDAVGGSAGGFGGAPGCGFGGSGYQTLATFRILGAFELPDCSVFASQYVSSTVATLLYTDDGATWFAPPNSATINPKSGRPNALGEMLVGTKRATTGYPAAGVWYCTQAGCTQATGYTGLRYDDDVTAFSADIGGVIWAANTGHNNLVHRSTDHGRTWAPVPAPFFSTTGGMWTIEQDPYSGVLVGGETGSVMRSFDNGTTWVAYGLAHPPSYKGNLWSLEASPATGTVFAALQNLNSDPTASIQYHRITDTAGIWHSATGSGMNNWTDLTGFAFQPDGSVLAGGIVSAVSVIWKSTNDGSTWTRVGPTGLTSAVRISVGPSGCVYLSHGGGLIRNCGGL